MFLRRMSRGVEFSASHRQGENATLPRQGNSLRDPAKTY